MPDAQKFPTLVEVLIDHGCNRTERHAQDVASAWRAACTITSVDQLDTLPEGAVALGDDGLAYQRSQYDSWHEAGTEISGTSVPLPALLIWHPDWVAA